MSEWWKKEEKIFNVSCYTRRPQNPHQMHQKKTSACCTCMCVCMYVCMHVCRIHTYIHTKDIKIRTYINAYIRKIPRCDMQCIWNMEGIWNILEYIQVAMRDEAWNLHRTGGSLGGKGRQRLVTFVIVILVNFVLVLLVNFVLVLLGHVHDSKPDWIQEQRAQETGRRTSSHARRKAD